MATNNLAQDWPLRNDQIVLLVLGGMKQKEVAKEYNLTPQAVSKIIRDPRAEEVLTHARDAILEKMLSGMDDQMTHSARLAIKCVRRTLEADIGPTHKAKGNQDRVAIAMLRGRGFLSQETNEGERNFLISPAQFERLVGAMEKSDEAKKINPFESIPEAEAVEVE